MSAAQVKRLGDGEWEVSAILPSLASAMRAVDVLTSVNPDAYRSEGPQAYVPPPELPPQIQELADKDSDETGLNVGVISQ